LSQEETPGTNTRLEQLLSDEETIAEAKQHNIKLIEFLSKKENMKQLVKYATRMPDDPTNKTQAHK
jgi:hypothetical protein